MRVSILGVGLMGGSLGLAWKKRRPELVLTGYDRPAVLEKARRRGAVDHAAETLEQAVAGAAVVVLAAPLAENAVLLPALAPLLPPGAVVTDVGSVKAAVVAQARSVLPAANPFVGGHPMAGAEQGGIDHADALLFENATWVLCPPEATPEAVFIQRFASLIDLVEATGARVLLMEAGRHDRIAALVSHLPQLVAVTLMNLAAARHAEDDGFLRLAAGGFRDLTRIAASPFPIWHDILRANTPEVVVALTRIIDALDQQRQDLHSGQVTALEAAFIAARTTREAIPRNTKGFLHPLAEVFVYVEDQPGALLTMLQALLKAGLNLKDIELLKIREGTGGTFRLGFARVEEALHAQETLLQAGYSASRM
jgi:prephenate dehydrogenase